MRNADIWFNLALGALAIAMMIWAVKSTGHILGEHNYHDLQHCAWAGC